MSDVLASSVHMSTCVGIICTMGDAISSIAQQMRYIAQSALASTLVYKTSLYIIRRETMPSLSSLAGTITSTASCARRERCLGHKLLRRCEKRLPKRQGHRRRAMCVAHYGSSRDVEHDMGRIQPFRLATFQTDRVVFADPHIVHSSAAVHHCGPFGARMLFVPR